MLGWFKAVLQEVKKVSWPKRKDLIQLTIFIIVICAVVALIILGLDIVFIKMRDLFLKI